MQHVYIDNVNSSTLRRESDVIYIIWKSPYKNLTDSHFVSKPTNKSVFSLPFPLLYTALSYPTRSPKGMDKAWAHNILQSHGRGEKKFFCTKEKDWPQIHLHLKVRILHGKSSNIHFLHHY